MSNRVNPIVTDQELNAIMWIESSGNPEATVATSSAEGLGQFLKGTWREEVQQHRPDVFKALPDTKLLAMRRKNPSFMIEILGHFTADNRKAIGPGASLGDLYLAHFLGLGAARGFYRADPNTPVDQILTGKAGRAAIQANRKILAGKTAGQVRVWAAGRMSSASKKAGDYVGKYYKGKFVLDTASMGLVSLPAEVEAEEEVFAEIRPGLVKGGDVRLYDNQQQLKGMNYNPGTLDGVWGGGTSGALTAFLTDYAPEVIGPNKWEDYRANYAELDALIDKAEREHFVRPVTKARQEAAPEVVEKVAPEIVDAKQSKWAGVTAFFGAVGTSIVSAFNWLMGYKDEASEWGIMYYLDRVPTFVWYAAGSALLGFVLYKAIRTVKGIEKPVTTGERM